MSLTCYIVDDESHSIEILKDYIEETPGLELLETFTNPVDALHKITTGDPPDITFMDIDMPQLSGIELFGLVSSYTSVIFTTAYSKYAVDAFDKEVTDFLLKPITYERFLKSIEKLKRSNPRKVSKDYFYIKTEVKGRIIKIKFDEILYIEGLANYVSIYVPSGKYSTYLTIKEIENVLLTAQFFRVHKSFIVNTEKIKRIEGNTIVLEDQSTVQVGPTYKDAFIEFLNPDIVKSKRRPN